MNEREKKVVSRMIMLYCRSKHSSVKGMCGECESLKQYAFQRLERCPFGEEKPSCIACTIHCYKNSMRIKIKEVMRFAGPRMLFRYPTDTIRHLYREHKYNRRYIAKNNLKQSDASIEQE